MPLTSVPAPEDGRLYALDNRIFDELALLRTLSLSGTLCETEVRIGVSVKHVTPALLRARDNAVQVVPGRIRGYLRADLQRQQFVLATHRPVSADQTVSCSRTT